MKNVKRDIVSAVIVSKDGKILLAKPHKGGVWENCWRIIGGGVEDEETRQQALAREVREEVGIDIMNISPVLLSDSSTAEAIKTDRQTGEKYRAIMHFFTYRIDLAEDAKDISVTLGEELQIFTWVLPEKLRDYEHTPPSITLFTALGWL